MDYSGVKTLRPSQFSTLGCWSATYGPNRAHTLMMAHTAHVGIHLICNQQGWPLTSTTKDTEVFLHPFKELMSLFILACYYLCLTLFFSLLPPVEKHWSKGQNDFLIILPIYSKFYHTIDFITHLIISLWCSGPN